MCIRDSSEREFIRTQPALLAAMKDCPPTEWAATLQRWRDDEAAKIAARTLPSADDEDGMRRQALHDLQIVASEFATLQDGRRQKLFSLACKVGKYVAHGIVTEGEFVAAFKEAASANGALNRHGTGWAVQTLRSAINTTRGDKLPPLARAFRSEVRV